MRREDFNYGELTKEWLDEKEGKLTVTSKFTLNKPERTNYAVELHNKKGMKIWGGEYTEIQSGLDYLEKYLVKKLAKSNTRPTPFSQFCAEIDTITEVNFSNSKANRLSNSATFNGWDAYRTSTLGVVKIHNAGNDVLWFDLLQERLDVKINLVNISSYGSEMDELPKVLIAVKKYLQVPIKERTAEFSEEEYLSDAK